MTKTFEKIGELKNLKEFQFEDIISSFGISDLCHFLSLPDSNFPGAELGQLLRKIGPGLRTLHLIGGQWLDNNLIDNLKIKMENLEHLYLKTSQRGEFINLLIY